MKYTRWQSQDNCGSDTQLGATELTPPIKLRSRLLRPRNDALLDASLRPGPTRDYLSSVSSSGRCNDCCRHSHQQDGSRSSAVLWSNARATMGDQHGKLREWWWLLPL